MRGRFVPTSTIMRRMHEKDARVAREMRRCGLPARHPGPHVWTKTHATDRRLSECAATEPDAVKGHEP
jgi:hypothetical protein